MTLWSSKNFIHAILSFKIGVCLLVQDKKNYFMQPRKTSYECGMFSLQFKIPINVTYTTNLYK